MVKKICNHSPSEQIGLEMTILRMIAFHPDQENTEKKNLKSSLAKKTLKKNKDNSINSDY